MINYDSILSAFDGKPTLLQWLKMVKKALDESILKNVDIVQNGEKVVFSFNFEDGTIISTPEVTLPKGDKGDKGENGVGIVNIETTGSQVVGVNTESTIRVELSDGSVKQFKTYAKNGIDGVNGNDGVNITGIETVSNEVVGDETLTTLRANYSNGTSDEFAVKAKNGASSTIYTHLVTLSGGSNKLFFKVISTKETLTLDDALKQIPDVDYVNHIQSKKIPACFTDGSKFGVVTIGKWTSSGKYMISINGVVVNGENIEHFYINTSANLIEDTLLGVNL